MQKVRQEQPCQGHSMRAPGQLGLNSDAASSGTKNTPVGNMCKLVLNCSTIQHLWSEGLVQTVQDWQIKQYPSKYVNGCCKGERNYPSSGGKGWKTGLVLKLGMRENFLLERWGVCRIWVMGKGQRDSVGIVWTVLGQLMDKMIAWCTKYFLITISSESQSLTYSKRGTSINIQSNSKPTLNCKSHDSSWVCFFKAAAARFMHCKAISSFISKSYISTSQSCGKKPEKMKCQYP